ncbi:MAG: hypothetical protein ACLFTT_14615 [Candidatus Hydrogenedentota bacterium]
MTAFEHFKRTLARTVNHLRGPRQPGEELMAAIDSADDWHTLERKLGDLRTRARRRQQEVLERLQPLSDKVEQLLTEAKKARIRVVRDNLLRQAEGYMVQLEAEDQPAAVHGANVTLITNLLKRVQRAKAMAASGVTPDAVEAIAAQLEDIVGDYETVQEAARDLEEADVDPVSEAPQAGNIEARLGALTVETEAVPTPEAESNVEALERKLYAAQAE